jgi:hypothetical protein
VPETSYHTSEHKSDLQAPYFESGEETSRFTAGFGDSNRLSANDFDFYGGDLDFERSGYSAPVS